MVRVLFSPIISCLMLLSISASDLSHDVTEKHSVVRRNTNTNSEYTTILNFWQEHKKELVLHENDEEVVLMMGNTGAGKSTLVAALVGRKLRAIIRNGYRAIVDDDDRIGTGSSSKTLIPEASVDRKNKVTYIDCAGFRDNRNVEYELSSIYFQNILMNRVKKVKFVFVINYDSLKNTGNKNDFDDLFEHIGEFIKDISKFHDGIALVATKVENIREESEDGSRLILVNDNQSVLDGIGNYLKEKKETYRTKTDNLDKYKMFVGLIDALLQKHNNAYTKIAIFRQPAGQGLLTKLKATNDEINTITKMILENLRYIQKTKNDFGFALSERSKNILDRIVTDIFRDALTKRLHKLGNETLTHYAQIEKQYSDIGFLQMQVSNAFDAISRIKNANEPLELFQNFLNATNYLNISVSLTNLNTISEDIKALKFFTTISDTNGDLHMMLLKSGTQNVTESIENVKNFYEFLNNLQTNLDSYTKQELKHDSRIGNIIRSCASSKTRAVQNIVDLESIVEQIGVDGYYSKIRTLMLNQFQLKHLGSVFGDFSSKLEFACAGPSKPLIVKGYNIRMSDVVKIECWSQAKNIQVFASNKIFLDYTIDKTGTEAQLFIISPTWEVFGRQKIILDGKAGSPHEKTSAKSAASNKENGADGLPGLPGGSAGHFFGVGKKFINADYLEIQANGGSGGPGQDGGNGAKGFGGKELPQSFFNTQMHFEEMKEYFREHNHEYSEESEDSARSPISFGISVYTRTYLVTVLPTPATKPTDGGNGGAGGKGGYSGKILINGLGKSVSVKTSNNKGSVGRGGQGGIGGEKTWESWTKKFYCIAKSSNNCKIRMDLISTINGPLVPAGQNGKPGFNTNGEKLPVQTIMANTYLAINTFKDFLRINLFENTKELELRNHIHEMDTNNFIKSQYNTLGFVKEFHDLENISHELRNKINLVPFYDSFLYRIEEFAMSEENLENKKVLSYMYTAALTKVFTLKKKRMGKTVVDLARYLGTIESSVKEIREAQHLEIVQNYRNEYENNLHDKIREANDFIENKIEPEINRLWEESDKQIKAIVDEIRSNKNSTEDAITALEKKKGEIREMMRIRSILLPLKLAASALSFAGPIGAGVGVAVTGTASIAEGILLNKMSSKVQSKVPTLNPNLKLMGRITEVLNNKPKLLAEKLTEVMGKLEKNQEDLSTSQRDKIQISQKIGQLKAQINEVQNRKAGTLDKIAERETDLKRIEKNINEFTNSRKDIMVKEKKLLSDLKAEQKNAEKLNKEIKLEKSIRFINHAQSILNGAEMVYSVVKQLGNDEDMIQNVSNQISEYGDQLKDLNKLEDQVYDIIMPDLKEIEKTINGIVSSVSGSSHAKLDLTKWTVRSTLRDVKSLLQKFTHKMTFELQSDLMRFMEKIDEGFSILINIYDRIDSYSDSVKQAEYMAHIVSAPMMSVQVKDSELSQALISLKLGIHSNILLEKYGIALHAFKQHYFPFAAHVLQQFQLPKSLQLNDIESLRANIVERIRDMKNHIDESEATIGEYSKFTHNKNVFNSNTTGSAPFYVWKHETIKTEVQQLLSGSEILIKADISKGLNYNSVKFSDIGLNFKLRNETLQNSFNSVLRNFELTMTMVGNNYYRCGERYYFISFDDDITISYTLQQDDSKNWINPNGVYSAIRDSHTFLSPYGLWSIRLRSVNRFVSSDQLKIFANESIDLELVGRGYYIEQESDFNFNVCNGYLVTFYDVENIVKELS